MDYPIITYSGIKNKPWVLVRDFRLPLSNGDVAIIPKGYWTDFASVPRPLKLIFNHLGRGINAFVIHDYCYNFRGYKVGRYMIQGNRADMLVTRKFADQEMKYQMLLAGESKFKSWLYYIAVRIGGFSRFGTI